MKKLTIQQKNVLEVKLRKAKEASERNRLCVILGHNDGHTIEDLSKVLRISHATVCNYLKDFDSEEKTENDLRGGAEPKLTEEQSSSLLKHLTEVTYLKVKHICGYVRKIFGVVYSRSGMTKWLQAHGFVFKKPKKVPGKLDPQKQALFIAEYEALKKGLKEGEEIYFGDAVHPEHQTQAVCGWIRKGIQKTLQTTGKQKRIHIAGAIRLKDMKVLTKEYETVNADAMLDFFQYLENTSKASTIYVILDNARANKNKKLEEYLKTSRIKVRYLPPYSPNLNPIERLWKIMRETKLYNRYYESSMMFFQEIRSFFQECVPKMTQFLATRINDKFQTITLDPINLAV